MNKKTISKKYYFGISKILIVYILISILSILFKIKFLDYEYNFLQAIKGISNFTANDYSWYIEMYIGLFLLVPFLNIVYNNLSKKHKIILIITLLFLTSTQSMFNINEKVVQSWWIGIYPITYYFIGCYLQEYQIKMSKIKNILLIFISLIIFGSINYDASYNIPFLDYQTYNSIQFVVLSVLVFIFLVNIKINKAPKLVEKILIKMSDLSLGAYLSSYIFDMLIYPYFNKISIRFSNYFIILPIVFVCSYILSMLVNGLINTFKKILIKNSCN